MANSGSSLRRKDAFLRQRTCSGICAPCGGAPGARRVACRVIAPPKPPSTKDSSALPVAERSSARGGQSEASSSPASFWSVVTSTTAVASQLVSHFKAWGPASPTPELAKEVLQEASNKEREKSKKTQPAVVTQFLSPAGVWELKGIRKLAHLTALTYYMHLVTPRNLSRMHNLELVTTSRACEIRPYEHLRTAVEVGDDGDGMAVSVQSVQEMYHSLRSEQQASSSSSSDNNIVSLPKELPFQVVPQLLQQQAQQQPVGGQPQAPPRPWKNPADVVTAKLAEAASAASAAASAASAAALASAAESLYAGLVSLPLPASLPLGAALGANNRASNAVLLPAAGGPSGMDMDSSAKVSSVAIAAIAAAEFRQQQANEKRRSPAVAAAPVPSGMSLATPTCPSEWFVVDDASSCTRTVVIQGSDTIDHWRLNLTFDPVTFEEPSLGIKVHRGVYQAALELYQHFLPLVYEHLESSPFAKVTFTGHSVGGSLATLLMLMFKLRGVLQPHNISTVYTFGAPAVFCQVQQCSTDAQESCGPSDASYSCNCGERATLLASLGLPEHIVRNVIMTRDIVPRAYACDYSLVADILKGWGPSFKDHCCLNRDGRKHLYYFIGRMVILQPDSWHSFIAGDPYHPMLPHGPELYNLVEPETHAQPQAQARPSGASMDASAGSASSSTASTGSVSGVSSMDEPAAASGAAAQAAAAQAAAAPAAPLAVARGSRSGGKDSAVAVAAAAPRVAASVTEAIWELMDCPHPLETLADPAAYMASGIISRYHNPDNYTKALGRIIYLKRRQEKRLPNQLQRGFRYTEPDNSSLESAWECSDLQDVVPIALPQADVHDSW